MSETKSARLDQTGRSGLDVIAQIRANRHDDAPWREGRIFGLIFHPDDPDLERLLHEVSDEYLAENALSPVRFPSLARLERETVDMVADLLHGGTGGMTSGGTESIFVAVSVARDVARERGIESSEIITATTAHPAFAKACHLLGVRQHRVAVTADHRVDVDAVRAAITPDTVLLVASPPNYPYGVIDPVGEIAALAGDRGLLCHVDACLGGLILPFWEQLGEPVPTWDFRVPGVTSVSADIHKYGYSFKGASVVLFADEQLARRRYWFDDDVWGGGLYATPTPAGTRPAPPIAAAWATLRYHGREGFRRKAAATITATQTLIAGVEAIPDLRLSARPDGPVVRFESDTLDIAAVADAMEGRRWWLNRQPGALHAMLSPFHTNVVDTVVRDLRDAVAEVRAGRRSTGNVAVYAGPSGDATKPR